MPYSIAPPPPQLEAEARWFGTVTVAYPPVDDEPAAIAMTATTTDTPLPTPSSDMVSPLVGRSSNSAARDTFQMCTVDTPRLSIFVDAKGKTPNPALTSQLTRGLRQAANGQANNEDIKDLHMFVWSSSVSPMSDLAPSNTEDCVPTKCSLYCHSGFNFMLATAKSTIQDELDHFLPKYGLTDFYCRSKVSGVDVVYSVTALLESPDAQSKNAKESSAAKRFWVVDSALSLNSIDQLQNGMLSKIERKGVILRQGSYLHCDPWPPPLLLLMLSGTHTVSPPPWPFFSLVHDDYLSRFFSWPWKPPWLPSVWQILHLSLLDTSLVHSSMVMKIGHASNRAIWYQTPWPSFRFYQAILHKRGDEIGAFLILRGFQFSPSNCLFVLRYIIDID